ncbi:MAG: tyrosine-type recombinase/integrase, partial [bacterium]
IRAVWRRPELPRADRLHRLLQQMKADVFPPGAKAPDFVRLRDSALVLWYIETGARRREGLVRVEDIDLEFARATTVQKVRREAETRHLFYHSVRHLLRYYLDEREQYLQALGKEDVRELWITDDGEPLTPDAVSHIFQRIKRRYGWEGSFHPHKLRAVAATMAALAKDRTALEIKMGWAPNTPVAKRYIHLAQEQEAMAEMVAAVSPLRAMARLRRPRS